VAQTKTLLIPGGIGDFMRLKMVSINIANGAAETSIALDYSLYGLNSVLCYGHTIRDTYTNNVQFDNLSGTTVTHTWSAADVADVIVWAIGY
jgi:hypothetical protein